jgi:putative ABC transport system ATP-binding protein
VPPPSLLELSNIRRSFDKEAVIALHDVTLSVFAGDCMSIMGSSGSGKTSLMHVMCGMDSPSAGTVRWKGETIGGAEHWCRLRSSEIGVIFQDFLLLPALTALQNVQVALSKTGSIAKKRDLALAALARVGVAHRAKHYPHQLSGGERQRVAIARGLVNEPQLILADEPTGNLDSQNSHVVADLLFELQHASEHALVLVTHDSELAQRCQRQVRLSDGRIVQDT